jgi:hypothetical protein
MLIVPLPALATFAGIALFRPPHRRAWLAFGFGTAAIATGVVGLTAVQD